MQLLAGIGPLGLPELAVIAFIILLVFGVGRLPEVGGAVGKGIREFRKATKDDAPSDSTALPGADSKRSTERKFCVATIIMNKLPAIHAPTSQQAKYRVFITPRKFYRTARGY